MSVPLYPELAERLGERYTESVFECSFYRRDLAAVPRLLQVALAQTMPQAVVRPRDADDVAAVVRYAAEHRLPLTPRAAATTVYWNAVPVRGGLVIDLNDLRGAPSVNPDAMTVTVPAATRWGELEEALQPRGLATLAYPTSAPSATVGGWVNMEGCGLGSLKYGRLADQLVSLQVVLPSGEIIQATPRSDPPLAVFAQAEGTLGIVTQVEMKIRAKPWAVVPHLLALRDAAALEQAMVALAAVKPAPYTIHFSDSPYATMLRDAGFPPPADGYLLLIVFDGSADEVDAGARALKNVALACQADELDAGTAQAEWEERFLALRLKRAGPTLLGAEVWLPLDRFNSYAADVARLARRQRTPLATYGTVVTPRMATVMSVLRSDESRTVPYVLDLSLTQQLVDIAFRHGGRPYGIGFWNAPYYRRALPPLELAKRLTAKQRLDPLGIMNPGKVYQPPALLPPFVFNTGMQVLSSVRSLGRRIR